MYKDKFQSILTYLLFFSLLTLTLSGCLEHNKYIEMDKVNVEKFNMWNFWQNITDKLGVNSSNTKFVDCFLSFCKGEMINLYLSFIVKENDIYYSYNVYLARKELDKYLFTYNKCVEKRHSVNFSAEEIFKRLSIWNISEYFEKAGLNQNGCEIEMEILVNTGISENGGLTVFKREKNGYIKTTGNLIYKEGKACLRIAFYGSPVAYYEVL